MVDTLHTTSLTKDTTTGLMNLNQLFLELKNNLISVEKMNKMTSANNNNNNFDSSTGRMKFPRTNTAPIIRAGKKKTRTNITDYNFTLPTRGRNVRSGSADSDEVVGRLNSLMDDLETSFSSLLKSNVSLDTDSSDAENDEAFEVATSPSQKYVLDNFSQYLYRKYSLRSKDSLKPIKPPRRMSDSRLNDFHRQQTRNSSSSSDSGEGMLHNISQHSTLCRRLKTLEASFGLTLKKQLHSVIVKRMREMNVSGCVYCLYALYEKQKRDAEEKVKQIRKTLQEQEHLQERLRQQKEESDADNEWLKSEDEKAYVETASQGDPSSPTDPSTTDPSTTDEVDSKTRLSKRHSYNGEKTEYDKDRLSEVWDRKMEQTKNAKSLNLRQSTNHLRRNTPFRASMPLWAPMASTDEQRPKTQEGRPLPPVPSSPTEVERPTQPAPPLKTKNDNPPPPKPERSLSSEAKASNSDDEYARPQKHKNDDMDPAAMRRSKTISAVDRPKSRDSPGMLRRNTETARSSRAKEVLPANDIVYQHTTSVVKSVIEFNTGVQHAQPEEFVDLVKVVGLNLRDLLAEVDNGVQNIPESAQKEIEMAHKVLSSDMAELVAKMKLAQKYAETTLGQENKRLMLAAAHALAIDAKNLYDTYSKVRENSLNNENNLS